MPMYDDSRYRFCELHRDDDDETTFLTDPEPIKYSDEYDNTVHVAKEGDTWWGLAHKYFPEMVDKCKLWWILAEFQPVLVVDPTIKIKGGEKLVIPSIRFLRLKVFDEDRRREH